MSDHNDPRPATARQALHLRVLLDFRVVPGELRERTLAALDRGATKADVVELVPLLRACQDVDASIANELWRRA